MKISINTEQKLYVFNHGKYIDCLGFDVCIRRRNLLAIELNRPELKIAELGTMEAYDEYKKLTEIARLKNAQTGWKSSSELTPELVGLEGKRVEVITSWGEKNRFIVGRSTGFIPCHLEIKKRNSSGGGAVCGSPFQSVKVLETVR